MSNPPSNKEQSTSVFNVLGSYADRIRDTKAGSSKPNDSTPDFKSSNNASMTTNGTSHTSSKISSSSTSTSTNTSSMSKLGRGGIKDKNDEEQPVKKVEEEQWETVQVGRSKSKLDKDEKRGNGAGGSNNASGSNSRNWRERPARENKDKDKDEDEKRSSKAGKKASSSVPPSTSTERIPRLAATTTTIPSGPTKPAWGASTPISQQQPTIPPSQTTPGSTTSTSIQTPKTNSTNPTRSRTEPPSPSLNGTTVTAESASLASPNLSGTSTAATSVKGKGDADVEDWSKLEDRVPPTPVIKQPAPPPAVNPWEVRKKAFNPTTSSSTSPAKVNGTSNPTPAQMQNHNQTKMPLSNESGSTSSGLQNGDGFKPRAVEGNKGGKKTKKANSEPSSAILGGKEMWPEVSQAAEAGKKEEEKRAVKEKKDSEEGSVAETFTGGPKKTKWVNIPAQELQAAVDEAERVAAIRRKAAKDAASPIKAKGPRKAISVDGRKGRSTSINADVRIPPVPRVPVIPQYSITPNINPNVPTAQIPTFKPMFGTVRAGSIATSDITSDHTSEVTKTDAVPTETATTSTSAPLSRITSRQSRSGSKTQVSSPAGVSVPLDPTAAKFTSNNPNLVNGNGNNHTQPIPPFQTRGHRGRLSFNRGGGGGGGRGGFRGSGKGAFMGSPPGGYVNGLPGGEMYQRGFGAFMGQGQGQGMYMMGGGAGLDGLGQVNGFGLQRGIVHPPPPMPQSMVPGLDGLRFYVLGQVEYYFSMQNLAMDFFLRQQMDSDGWIDVSMVASFNRVKSLTPDVAIVNECMNFSTLLEVRDDKVRLRGGESHKWVLPDARPTTVMSSREDMSVNGNGNGTETTSDFSGVTVDEEMNSEIEDVMSSMGMVGGRYAPGEVENALMKNGSGSGSGSGGALGLGLGLGLGKDGGQGQAEGQGLPSGDGDAGKVNGDVEIKEDVSVEKGVEGKAGESR